MLGNSGIPPRPHKELGAGSFILNFLIGLVLVFLVSYVIQHSFYPRHQGFYCDDWTIRKPYKEDTISPFVLIVSILIVPLIIIVLTEMYRSTCILELYSWKGYNIKPVFANSLKYYGYQLLALLLTFTAAQVTKYATGRLRPHFLDVCKPGVDLDGCQTEHKFLESYKCGGGDEGLIRSARMSFFSGHASLSLTAAVFLVIYVHCRLPRRQILIVVRSMVEFSIMAVAFWVGYGRLTDNAHHLGDVLTGFGVGGVVGYLTAVKIAGLSSPKEALQPINADTGLPFIDSEEGSEGGDGDLEPSVPRYKTSVVRVEPTELRIFA